MNVDRIVEAFRQTGPGALAITEGGRTVVDVWQGEGWERDTLVNVYSVTKGVVATVAHVLVDRGLLDLDARMSRYWPEFQADVTVAQVLNHQAGLPAVREDLPPGGLFDWDVMTSALAAQEPWWEPGTRHGYHALMFGWLVGEVLRRITGKEVRDLVGELGVADLFIGLPSEVEGRVLDVLPPEITENSFSPGLLAARAFQNPPTLGTPGIVNTESWRRAQIPAANGHATARALAELYGRMDGLLSPGVLAEAIRPHSEGHDEILEGNTRFGLGYMLPNELRAFSPNARAFGHPGAGGSLAFADPDLGIGFAYVTNRIILGPVGGDPRWWPLLDAIYG
ncbi:esterase [Lentzea sp. NBRC 105346]|uniref:serine hydrolase domain-containing protein n=1 Tax=Lentzea sp. NBRC 105346 TaxID=3032205 RepID=UPI0024A4666F|nr:serine hydrolase domain-containing protein [Lentzea sp. NBRC 105346]GLZ33752.1 esterase [Lentzea sp. NBRC 105346]